MINKVFILTILIIGSYVSLTYASLGSREVDLGNEAYSKEKYKNALEMYEDAASKTKGDARIDYDRAVASYKIGKYPEAVDFFNKTLLSDDEKLVRSAHYNLGNTFYQMGIDKENKEIASAVKSLEEALSQYDKVLASDKKAVDAGSNRVFVSGELERLRKKQKEQSDQKTGDKKNQQGSSNQDAQNQNQQNSGQLQNHPSAQSKNESAQDGKDKGSTTQEQNQANKDKQGQELKEQGKQQDKQQEMKQGQPSKPDSSKNQDASAEKSDQEKSVSQDEANMLLDDFSQNEQPKGMLKFTREQHNEKPVLKDW